MSSTIVYLKRFRDKIITRINRKVVSRKQELKEEVDEAYKEVLEEIVKEMKFD